MDKVDKWAELLLDTGKRNNLVNFKDTKLGTAEISVPDFGALFEKAARDVAFEVYDPKTEDGDALRKLPLSKADYISAYGRRLKGNQILLYNNYLTPIAALKNIAKKARTAIEETGVNLAYLAFGFVHWAEKDEPNVRYRSPLLLVPVTIENKSRAEPYYIKPDGDEIILNPIFAFKHNVKLPEYADEDIDAYLENVAGILAPLGWAVTRECKLGIFSFQKINMYRDLKDNAEKIIENENVKILLGEGGEVKPAPDGAIPELQNVVDADASQAEAVALSKTGQSFVLQGPPGTGKSQTITNIIAECLSDGKKVLFVSEKLAALNVVYDKLKKAGLSEFCLELHSYKANKKEFIGELCRTLRLPKSGVSPKAAEHIQERMRMEEKLSGYERELHRPREVIGKSLFEIFGEISAAGDVRADGYLFDDIENKGGIYAGEACDALSEYIAYVPSIGENYRENVWYGYKNFDISYSEKIKLQESLSAVEVLCKNMIADGAKFYSGYSIDCPTVRSVIDTQKLFALAGASEYLTPHMLGANRETTLKTVEKLANLAEEILSLKQTLDSAFTENVYELDGVSYFEKLSSIYRSAFKRLFAKEYKEIISSLRLCRKGGKKPKYTDALGYSELLSRYLKKSAEFEKLEKANEFGRGYCGVNTNFKQLCRESGELAALNADCGNLSALGYEEFVKRRPELLSLAKSVYTHYAAGKEGLEHLVKNFDAFDFVNAPLAAAQEKCARCMENIDGVENWCAFNALLARLDKLEIKPFTDFDIPAEQLIDAFKKLFYSQWADHILRSTPELALNRIPHDKAEEGFSENDKLQFEINKAEIKAKLSELRPSTELIASGGGVSVLLREGEKKRRQKSIRALMSETGELIQLLKPCFLMSPLSVSTFLSSDEVTFDTVIFDEASQIFPQDAVGAIYRGKQLIVVGDSRQMPPSNFFNSVADPDEEDIDVADFESILDLCSATFPQKRLKWHYRSRYEQLISFSNKNFYDGELVTFPSTEKDTRGKGVDFYFVPDGVFDHGTKSNRKEAEFVVDLIFKNIEKYPERSLGVVAFSISQQNLIEKLLNDRLADDINFFKADKAEPFFIKNLETVQGDERDTIIFSVGYGKDYAGKFLHNFGPLNRIGGERRLNVAITRAKHNVQLVSSVKYTDIDLSRTSAEGVRLLREYLDYAENGEAALNIIPENRPFDFESEVGEFLKANGFDVDTRVGCSDFKIDIAVKNPETGGYSLAVECDGENYHKYKTARDRDRLRREILEKAGWKYYRIWSADWFKNKRVEKEKLLLAARSKPTKHAEPAPESFEEEIKVKPFDFPEYEIADTDALWRKRAGDFPAFVKAVLETEAPLSEEWFLKRICRLFGREKVTSVVTYEYARRTAGLKSRGIIKKDGFLYLSGKPVQFRRSGAAVREIKYISLEELADGLLQLLKLNFSAEKEGLYKMIAAQSGFARTGDAIRFRLDCALELIADKIERDGDIITLK